MPDRNDKAAKQYKDIYVDYEYLICSVTFEKNAESLYLCGFPAFVLSKGSSLALFVGTINDKWKKFNKEHYMTKVNFYDSIDDSMLKFAVIIAKHNGKWVFCKHRERSTWEVPGGHREQGEDILETAKRELYEETGAINFEINPICIYSVTAPDNFNGKETFGKLFFAEIHTFEKDLHSEIEKIAIMNELPLNWTYPEIQPRLLEEARQRGFLPKKDEIKWLFFDVGSTLVDESSVYEDRMKKSS